MRNQINSVYSKAARLADITKQFLLTGKTARAKKCMAIADSLLETGNTETKMAISGTYLCRIASFMEIRHLKLSAHLPERLNAEYIKQVNCISV